MTISSVENWFDDNFHASRKQFSGSNSESFVWNRDDLPVSVFFSTLVMTAPVDMSLSVSYVGPVGNLTFSGAVRPLLATSTQVKRIAT